MNRLHFVASVALLFTLGCAGLKSGVSTGGSGGQGAGVGVDGGNGHPTGSGGSGPAAARRMTIPPVDPDAGPLPSAAAGRNARLEPGAPEREQQRDARNKMKSVHGQLLPAVQSMAALNSLKPSMV